MFMIIISLGLNFFAFLSKYASACEGSRAGIMPSNLEQILKAFRASLSVALTYLTLPTSFSHECSGPIPG